MNRLIACALVTSLLLGCNFNQPGEEPILDYSIVEMTVEDTIGVETGDEAFVFGDIAGVEIDSNGNVLVLDAVSCVVRRYSPQGEYLGRFAGLGSGPGEISDPMAMTILSDGGLAIADWAAWGIFLYDSTYSYNSFIGPMPGGSPLALAAGADNSIVGLGVNFWSEGEQPKGEYFLASWSESPSETFRFTEGSALIEPGEGGEVTINLPTLYFDSSPHHDVYAALSTDSTFLITQFSPSGLEIAVIEEGWERVLLNPQSTEVINAEARLNGEDISSEAMYADAIVGIHCDPSGKLWVRLGTSASPFFNVYSPSGEFLTSVEVTELSDPLFELDFLVSSENVFAWNTNPIDYPKVYVLSNPL